MAFTLLLFLFHLLPISMAADGSGEVNGNLGPPISFHDLQFFLSSTNESVVETAYLRFLSNGTLGDTNSDLLQNRLLFVRLEVLAYLREINNPDSRVIDLVIPLLRDPDARVQLAAGFTLKALTTEGTTMEPPDQWEQWWAQNKPEYTLLERSRILKSIPRNGSGYHARGCINYDLRFFTNALADFREDCRLGSPFTDYSQCRIWLIRSRSGERNAATVDLARYLTNRNPNEWSAKIGRFLIGQITEADLLNAAAFPGIETVDGQHCEASFYIGSKDLIDGNQKAAIRNFKECLATGSSNFEEYASAEIELLRLNLPATNSNIFGSAGDGLRLLLDPGDGHSHGWTGAGGYMGRGYRGSFYFGRAWTFPTLPKTNRVDIFYSPDKRKIVVMVLDDGPIYATANAGLHWAVFDTPGHYHFRLTGDEVDGGFIAAATLLPHPEAETADLIETNLSNQYGSRHSSEPASPKQDWYAVAIDAKGNKLILSSLSAPTLNITKAGALAIVSWPASFRGYVLQENTDITTPNWTDVTNDVDTVAGENQVAVTPQEANNFFRLRSTR